MVKVVENDDDKSRPISYLLLEDGSLFQGYSFGADRDSEGEIGVQSIKSRFLLFFFM